MISVSYPEGNSPAPQPTRGAIILYIIIAALAAALLSGVIVYTWQSSVAQQREEALRAELQLQQERSAVAPSPTVPNLPTSLAPVAIPPVTPGSSSSDQEGIRIALAQKHNVPLAEVSPVHIAQRIGLYATGGADIGSGISSGTVFFAVKRGASWIIAADGNGIPLCSEVDPYGIPREMLNACVDQDGNLKDR